VETVGQCEQTCTQDPECEIYQWFEDNSCFVGSSQRCNGPRRVMEGFRRRPTFWQFQAQQCEGLKLDPTTEGNVAQCQQNCECDKTCQIYQFGIGGLCFRGRSSNCEMGFNLRFIDSGFKTFRFKWKLLRRTCSGLTRDWQDGDTAAACRSRCAQAADYECSVWQFMENGECWRGIPNECRGGWNSRVTNGGYRWYIDNGASQADNTDDPERRRPYLVLPRGQSCRPDQMMTEEECRGTADGNAELVWLSSEDWDDRPHGCLYTDAVRKEVHWNRNSGGQPNDEDDERDPRRALCHFIPEPIPNDRDTTFRATTGQCRDLGDHCEIVNTQASCNAAASSLGLDAGLTRRMFSHNSDERPPGCFFFIAGSSLEFNQNFESTLSDGNQYQSLCHCPTPNFQKTRDQCGTLGDGCRPVSTPAACTEAANALGIDFSRAGLTHDSTERPPGCFLFIADNFLEFNQNFQSTLADSQYESLCECPTANFARAAALCGSLDDDCQTVNTPAACKLAANSLGIDFSRTEFSHDSDERPPGCFLFLADNVLEFNRNLHSTLTDDQYNSLCVCPSRILREQLPETTGATVLANFLHVLRFGHKEIIPDIPIDYDVSFARTAGRCEDLGDDCRDVFTQETCNAAARTLGINPSRKVFGHNTRERPSGCFLFIHDNSLEFNSNFGSSFTSSSFDSLCQCPTPTFQRTQGQCSDLGLGCEVVKSKERCRFATKQLGLWHFSDGPDHNSDQRPPGCFAFVPTASLEFNTNFQSTFTQAGMDSICQCREVFIQPTNLKCSIFDVKCRPLVSPSQCMPAADRIGLGVSPNPLIMHDSDDRPPGCFFYKPTQTMEFNLRMSSSFTASDMDSLCLCRVGTRGAEAAEAVEVAVAETVSIVEPPKEHELPLLHVPSSPSDAPSFLMYTLAAVGACSVTYLVYRKFLRRKHEEYSQV